MGEMGRNGEKWGGIDSNIIIYEKNSNTYVLLISVIFMLYIYIVQ